MTKNSNFFPVRYTFLHCTNDRFFFRYSHALYRLFIVSFFPFCPGMGMSGGALGRSSKLISVLEILFHSFCLGPWQDDCKGMPRDRLSKKGSDVVMILSSFHMVITYRYPSEQL